MKKCILCLETKPYDQFPQKGRDGRRIKGVFCLSCNDADSRLKSKAYSREYQERHPGKPALRAKEWYNDKRDLVRARERMVYRVLKDIVYEAYGNKCRNCGKQERSFLTIDHTYNDGAADRKKTGCGAFQRKGGAKLYAQIIEQNFPDSYQILCYECNMGKHRNGGVAPHKTQGSETIPKGSTHKCGEACDSVKTDDDIVRSARQRVAAFLNRNGFKCAVEE